MKADFGKHSSFGETLHDFSKHLMIEDRDGGHCKHPDPDATSCAAATVTNSDSPPCKHKIEWSNSGCGNAMRPSGCHFPDELDRHQQCVLCGMKKRYYCYSCFNKDKPKQIMPLC